MGPTRKSLQQYCSVPIEAVLGMPLTKNAAIARQLLTEAGVYNEMQDKEMAYCLYKRFCTLVLEVFPRHKEYRGASNRLQMRGCMEMSHRVIESLTLIAKELDEGDLNIKEEEKDSRKHLSDMESVEEPSHETVGGDSTTLPPPHVSEVAKTASEELPNQSTELTGRGSATSPPKNQKPLTLNEAMEILNVSKVAKEIDNTTTAVPCAPHLQTGAPSALSIPVKSDAAVELKRGRGEMGRLRPVFIPCSTVSEFTHVARPNTELGAEGIETCAILAGSIVSSNECGVGLQMTHLIFPEQHGGPNTCESLGEEALFEYMLNWKLITIGWIHTHPRQNCFLSSIDLHTQCGYQTMLPESIAIVVAPRDVKGNHVGVFRLHTPHGIKLIQVGSYL